MSDGDLCAQAASSPAKPVVKYELNRTVDETEKRNVEFKEIRGQNPCRSIVDNAEIYINAFLNSRVSGTGVMRRYEIYQATYRATFTDG